MPRQVRLDDPGVLHHVMAWGIERQKIFRDDRDREDFVGPLAGLAEKGAWCTPEGPVCRIEESGLMTMEDIKRWSL